MATQEKAAEQVAVLGVDESVHSERAFHCEYECIRWYSFNFVLIH